MAPVRLSFHRNGENEILVAFDKAGGEHLIAKIRAVIESGNHLHHLVPREEETGALTRKRPWFAAEDSKILEIQYQLEDDAEGWVD